MATSGTHHSMSLHPICLAFSVLLLVPLSGCSVGRYCARRGQDFTDCFNAAGPLGFGLHARVKATDFAVVSAGGSFSGASGWWGRYGFQERLGVDAGAPFVVAVDGYDVPHIGGAPYQSVTWGPCVTSREYNEVRPGPRGEFSDKFWVGGTATVVILSARFEFNPVEFADFLTGWFGWDLLEDDELHFGYDRALRDKMEYEEYLEESKRWQAE